MIRLDMNNIIKFESKPNLRYMYVCMYVCMYVLAWYAHIYSILYNFICFPCWFYSGRSVLFGERVTRFKILWEDCFLYLHIWLPQGARWCSVITVTSSMVHFLPCNYSEPLKLNYLTSRYFGEWFTVLGVFYMYFFLALKNKNWKERSRKGLSRLYRPCSQVFWRS
jgi:hypothetical protein